MKTLKEVVSEIKETIEANSNSSTSDKDKNKARKRLITLNLAKIFLEGNPTEEFTKSQKDLVSRYIGIHDARYKEWLSQGKNSELLEPRKIYKEQTSIDWAEVTKWKSELKFLNYILS